MEYGYGSRKNKMSQLVFSGAANHIDWNQKNEYQYSIGFGNATRYIANQMHRHGINFVTGAHNDASKPNLAFCYPDEFKFLPNQYSIAYMPWESTGLKQDWIDSLNRCDEVWTTSDWSKKTLDNLLDKPTFVYEHGIPKFCIPRKRKRPKDIIRFLHVGEPALRKGAQDVVDAFVELFGNDNRYQLIVKCSGINTTRIRNSNGESLGTPGAHYRNIVVIEDYLPEELLIDLYRKTDIFLYPSYGEGFGFNSAYSIAMGIPTICTAEWAPYRDFITAPLESEYIDSPWPAYHAGKMLEPNMQQMREYMIDITENYEKYSEISFRNAIGIHERFDWDKVSDKPMKRLKKIIRMTSK